MAQPDQSTAVFGAIAMCGTAHSLGERIGAPIPDDFYDPESPASLEWSDRLSDVQRRRLRAILWRYGGTVYFDSFLVSGALTFLWLTELGAILHLAERYPEHTQGHYARDLIAKVWRAWLRMRGLGHRIRRRSVR